MAEIAAGRAFPVARQTFTPAARAACSASTEDGRTLDCPSSRVPSISRARSLTFWSLLVFFLRLALTSKRAVLEVPLLLLLLASVNSISSPE